MASHINNLHTVACSDISATVTTIWTVTTVFRRRQSCFFLKAFINQSDDLHVPMCGELLVASGAGVTML